MRTGEPMLRSLVSLAVVGSLMVAGPALQAVASPQRTQPVGTELRNTPVVLVGSDVKGLDAPPVARTSPVTWPDATAGLHLNTVTAATPEGDAEASETTGGIGRTPEKVRVAVMDRTVSEMLVGAGVAMTATGAPGTRTRIAVEYSGVAEAVGGGWSSRLGLVLLPRCSLTTPSKEECRIQTPLPSTNDPQSQTVSAIVEFDASTMVVAATAGTSGGEGNIGASPLSASSLWEAGGSSGGFSWSYPLRVPPVPGGLAPSLGISYSSATADGRTAGSNNQSSWLGEGFDLNVGFIERRFDSCSDEAGTPGANNTTKTGDLCWWTDPKVTHDAPWDNAVLNLAGHSGTLVRESGSQWRLESDDGTRIEKLGTPDSGESWRVTTTDGTQYYFGKGAADGDPTSTNSRWAVPVAGNHAGEPGYTTSFASSFKSVPWRWNLDYVVSNTGQTITYRYVADVNKYKKNLTTLTSYERGGYLVRVLYGQQRGQENLPGPASVTLMTNHAISRSSWPLVR